MLLDCGENAQRLRCPEQIDRGHLDRQDRCRTLQKDNAMYYVLKGQ